MNYSYQLAVLSGQELFQPSDISIDLTGFYIADTEADIIRTSADIVRTDADTANFYEGRQ